MKNVQRAFVVIPTLVFAGFLFQACAATRGHDMATDTAVEMADLRTSIGGLKTQITAVSSSLSDIVKDSVDATPAFNQFVKASDGLTAATKKTQDILAKLRTDGSTYLTEWQQQNVLITDPDIKKTAEERRKDLSKSLDGVTKSMGEVVATYPPYLSRLKDARTFLSNDLSQAGIKSIDSTLNHLIKQGAEMSKSLDDVEKALDATIPKFQAAKAPPPAK
jgi:ABC-type transporter Mla subunit MlaD